MEVEIYVVRVEYGRCGENTSETLYVGLELSKAFEVIDKRFNCVETNHVKYLSVWSNGKLISEHLKEFWTNGFGKWERNCGKNMEELK